MAEDSGVLVQAVTNKRQLHFIWRTWLSGLREAPNGLPDEFWWPAHRGYIEQQLTDPQNVVLLAVAADAPDEILGWVVARPGERLEWVFVRPGLRGNGLAGILLRAAKVPDPTPSRWRRVNSRLRSRWTPRQKHRRSSMARQSES